MDDLVNVTAHEIEGAPSGLSPRLYKVSYNNFRTGAPELPPLHVFSTVKDITVPKWTGPVTRLTHTIEPGRVDVEHLVRLATTTTRVHYHAVRPTATPEDLESSIRGGSPSARVCVFIGTERPNPLVHRLMDHFIELPESGCTAWDLDHALERACPILFASVRPLPTGFKVLLDGAPDDVVVSDVAPQAVAEWSDAHHGGRVTVAVQIAEGPPVHESAVHRELTTYYVDRLKADVFGDGTKVLDMVREAWESGAPPVIELPPWVSEVDPGRSALKKTAELIGTCITPPKPGQTILSWFASCTLFMGLPTPPTM